MFKNAFIFTFDKEKFSVNDDFKKSVKEKAVPSSLAPGQESAFGTYEFLDDTNEYVYSVSGLHFLKLRELKKKVPASTINEAIKKQISDAFKRDGTVLKKKEAKEVVYPILLKNALTEISEIRFYIDEENSLIVVDSSSPKSADKVLDLLADIIGSRPFEILKVKIDSDNVFMSKVRDSIINEKNLKNALVFGEQIKMKSVSPDSKGTVDIKNEEILTEKVRDYLLEDKVVSGVTLIFQGRVIFKINEDLILTGIKFTDSLEAEIENTVGEDENPIAEFNASSFIFKNEIVDIVDIIKNVIN